jgi:hypothetical protein
MRYALVVTLLLAVMATRADAGRGAASLKYLPDDTNIVIVGDVARARGSQMFKKLFQLARDNNATLDTLASAQPVEKQIDTMVIGANATKQAVIVLEGRIDKLLVEGKKASTKSEKHAGITYWVTPDGELAVLDKKLVFTSAGLMPALIDRAKDKKAKGPGPVRTIMAATAANTAVFGGALLDAEAKSELKSSLGSEPQWATFSFAMAQKLTVDARLKFADDAAAASATKTINDQLTPERRGQLESFVGKEFSDSVTVDQQQSFARVAATLTSDELDKVIAFVKLLM